MNLNSLNLKIVVIKIGSSLIVKNGNLDICWISNLSQDIKILLNSGVKIILVSSGSVALGKKHLKNNSLYLKNSLEEKQISAAIGQAELISMYKSKFSDIGINVAQILLTNDESTERKKYVNIKNCINNLINRNIIPIINENDTITIPEVKIGDNDRLSARIAQMIDADLLIILSDVDGLYDKNPSEKDAKLLRYIKKIDKKIESIASSESSSSIGTGGMKTKINAIKMLANSNCRAVIANGSHNMRLKKIINSEINYSLFENGNNKLDARSQWIRGSMNIEGEVIIDEGAFNAIKAGKSLLPIGIQSVNGVFLAKKLVAIKDKNLKHIATGIANYDSKEIKEILGKKNKEEFIHRNNMVII